MSVTELEILCRALGTALLATVLRSTVLFVASAFVILLFRVWSVEIRHFIWRGVLYGLLLLPLLQFAVPPIRRTSQILTSAEITFTPLPQKIALAGAVLINPLPTRWTFSWILFLVALYLSVTGALLLRLGFGVLQLRKIVRRSEPVTELEEGLPPGTRIRVSPEVCVPMTAGIGKLFILLPSSWPLWPQDKLQAALFHESAHATRRDPTTAFLTSLAVCFFWIHPLAYWLRSHLAALSEEACDEATLKTVTPVRYAQMLLEFSADVAYAGSRLMATSPVAVQGSSMKKRLARIFSSHQSTPKNSRLIRGLLLSAFFPTLYLTAAARFHGTQTSGDSAVGQMISIGTQEQAATLESALRRNPEDLRARGALMAFYVNEHEDAEFTRHLLWAIDHHPENQIAAMRSYSRQATRPLSSIGQSLAEHSGAFETYEHVKDAWERALAAHSDSAAVLYHAGRYLEREDPRRALALFARAQNIAPSDAGIQEACLDAIASVDSIAVISGVTLPADLANTRDAALLSRIGTKIVQRGDDRLTQTGMEFLRRAIELEPGNPKWKEALESAQAEPIRRRNRQALSQRRNN